MGIQSWSSVACCCIGKSFRYLVYNNSRSYQSIKRHSLPNHHESAARINGHEYAKRIQFIWVCTKCGTDWFARISIFNWHANKFDESGKYFDSANDYWIYECKFKKITYKNSLKFQKNYPVGRKFIHHTWNDSGQHSFWSVHCKSTLLRSAFVQSSSRHKCSSSQWSCNIIPQFVSWWTTSKRCFALQLDCDEYWSSFHLLRWSISKISCETTTSSDLLLHIPIWWRLQHDEDNDGFGQCKEIKMILLEILLIFFYWFLFKVSGSDARFVFVINLCSI